MNIRGIFTGSDGRLRSGYRVAVFVTAFMFTASFLGLAGQSALAAFGLIPELSESALLVFTSLISLMAAVLSGWLAGKVLEGVPFKALGASFNNYWFKHLALGIFAGAASLTLAVSVAYVFGGLRFTSATVEPATIVRSLGISFLIFSLGAAWEEALFRGYILQTLSRSGLAWLGITLTSIFFGFVHWGNPNANAHLDTQHDPRRRMVRCCLSKNSRSVVRVGNPPHVELDAGIIFWN